MLKYLWSLSSKEEKKKQKNFSSSFLRKYSVLCALFCVVWDDAFSTLVFSSPRRCAYLLLIFCFFEKQSKKSFETENKSDIKERERGN
jgi:hypothetical protein